MVIISELLFRSLESCKPWRKPALYFFCLLMKLCLYVTVLPSSSTSTHILVFLSIIALSRKLYRELSVQRLSFSQRLVFRIQIPASRFLRPELSLQSLASRGDDPETSVLYMRPMTGNFGMPKTSIIYYNLMNPFNKCLKSMQATLG